MKDKTRQIKESISDLLELPKDIMMDLPRITLLGDMQIYIENHKGVIEYSKERIRVYTKSGVVRIVGKELSIKTIMPEEMMICGKIQNIEFVK